MRSSDGCSFSGQSRPTVSVFGALGGVVLVHEGHLQQFCQVFKLLQTFLAALLAAQKNLSDLKKKMLKNTAQKHVMSLVVPQDASHHQDYEPFLVGNPYKPSFVTGILGGGSTQVISFNLPR